MARPPFVRIDAEGGAIEIGHIWFAPILKQTRQATEAIFLTMRETFDRWGYRRLEWKCNSRNMPSRSASASPTRDCSAGT